VTERDGQAGGDPVGDLQRWLMRSGARGVGKELTGQIRRALGQGGAGQRGGSQRDGDVWETATTRSVNDSGEAPECAWCPVCRAARRLRESGPGLGTHLTEAGDALASVVQEAYSAFEAAMKAQQRPPGAAQEPPAASREPSAAESPGAESGAARPRPAEDTGSAPDDRR
jgi:hypothetical protein